MNELLIFVSIIFVVFLLYKFFKPYFLKYDTTILFTGGLGSGKSLNSVKYSLTLLKKSRLKVAFKNFKIWFRNLNKKKEKMSYIDKPMLFSNIPIRIKNGDYSMPLTKAILTLKVRIPEYSVVFIDEMPQLVNQFNWNVKEVKGQLNEFITYFRHYIGGYLIVNGQAESEIVKQVRAKLNSYFWCFDFQKFLFFFYRVRILHSQCTENEISINSDFIEDKTKWTYGILPFKRYNSRAYKKRYLNIKDTDYLKIYPCADMKDLTTNKVITFNQGYESPLD